jgi:hypothetical protein
VIVRGTRGRDHWILLTTEKAFLPLNRDALCDDYL